MNKLIFNDVGFWPHSLELCEIARVFIDNGDKVFFLSSNDTFFGNPSNPLCFEPARKITQFRNKLIHKELEKHGIKCFFIKQSKNLISNKFKKIITKNLLDSIYGNYCEILKDGLANRKSIHFKDFRSKTLLSIERSFEFLELFIKKNNIQEIVVWNGRRPAEVFLVDLAKLYTINYSSIITSQLEGRFAYKMNWSNVNDINFYGKEIFNKLIKYKKSGFHENSIKKANLYYKRAQGLIDKPESFSSRGFYTYSENYKESEKLKNKISKLKLLNKKIVSIFPGTFMEYMSLPNYCDDPIKKNHYEHIKFLLSVNLDNSHFFILRFHPNQEFVRFNEQLEIKNIFKEAKLKSNFHIILPNENISSYEIIKASDYVVAIGSSISVEALRMRKKVMFLGRNWFQSLESLYKPDNENDIISFLYSNTKFNPNSYRDTVIFVETLLDDNHTKFKYYKSLTQIIKKSFVNLYLPKIAFTLKILAEKLFLMKFLFYHFVCKK